jgi:hypothetical protein
LLQLSTRPLVFDKYGQCADYDEAVGKICISREGIVGYHGLPTTTTGPFLISYGANVIPEAKKLRGSMRGANLSPEEMSQEVCLLAWIDHPDTRSSIYCKYDMS